TGLTAAAGNPVGHGPVVPYLTGHAEPAAEELPVADDAAAESGAEGDHHHVGVSGSRSMDELAPGGGVGVVLDDDWQPGGLLDESADRLVLPAQVGSEMDA